MAIPSARETRRAVLTSAASLSIDFDTEVRRRVRSADWQTFILAMVVLVGGGYALVFAPNVAGDVRLAIAGYIGAVIVYFFGRQVAANTAASTIRTLNEAANNDPNIPTPPRPGQ